MLDDDHVAVLEPRHERERGDRHGRRAGRGREAGGRPRPPAPPGDLAVQRAAPARRRPQPRASGVPRKALGHVHAHSHERQPEAEPGHLLRHDAERHEPVALEPLERSALDAQDQPQRARRQRPRGGPGVLGHADDRRQHVAAEHRDDRYDHGQQHEPPQPAPHSAARVGVARRDRGAHLARDGGLQGRARDHQDDERGQQRRQRAVARLAQHAREDDREGERHHVAGHHGAGHADRAAGVGSRQRSQALQHRELR